MPSGRRLDLLDPSPNDIEIEDIAHGLARVARWNGQTVGEFAFSVAQHALVVEEIATALQPDLARRWRLAALLHDAPEYVIGDLISPFKAAIGLDYKAFEWKLLEAIHRRFGLPPSLPERVLAAIKTADRIAAFFEATELAGFTAAEANRYFGLRGVAAALGDRLRARPCPSRSTSAVTTRFQACGILTATHQHAAPPGTIARDFNKVICRSHGANKKPPFQSQHGSTGGIRVCPLHAMPDVVSRHGTPACHVPHDDGRLRRLSWHRRSPASRHAR
jgi:5'-deoxynucleotidase YfbR-like HD superfamily hydrolase